MVRPSASCATLPGSTKPPRRMRRPSGTPLDMMSLGVAKKANAPLLLSAKSTSALATPSMPSPNTTTRRRLRLRVIGAGSAAPLRPRRRKRGPKAMLAPPRAVGLRRHDDQHQGGEAVGGPDEAGIAAHGEELPECLHQVTDLAAWRPLGSSAGS